jgi:hypothetical protein
MRYHLEKTSHKVSGIVPELENVVFVKQRLLNSRNGISLLGDLKSPIVSIDRVLRCKGGNESPESLETRLSNELPKLQAQGTIDLNSIDHDSLLVAGTEVPKIVEDLSKSNLKITSLLPQVTQVHTLDIKVKPPHENIFTSTELDLTFKDCYDLDKFDDRNPLKFQKVKNQMIIDCVSNQYSGFSEHNRADLAKIYIDAKDQLEAVRKAENLVVKDGFGFDTAATIAVKNSQQAAIQSRLVGSNFQANTAAHRQSHILLITIAVQQQKIMQDVDKVYAQTSEIKHQARALNDENLRLITKLVSCELVRDQLKRKDNYWFKIQRFVLVITIALSVLIYIRYVMPINAVNKATMVQSTARKPVELQREDLIDKDQKNWIHRILEDKVTQPLGQFFIGIWNISLYILKHNTAVAKLKIEANLAEAKKLDSETKFLKAKKEGFLEKILHRFTKVKP